MLRLLRNILLFPLALFRLIAILLISGIVVIVGIIWLKTCGFSLKLQRWVLQTWGKSLLFVLGVKVDRNELPGNNNFILMPNHRSYLDIFIVAALTPSAMVGKAEIAKWPFGKVGFKLTNSIFVDRKNTRSMINTMNQIKSSADMGIPVTLFPEGTTYKGPLTKKFKNGSFKIAADAQIPVIPMAIHFKDINDAWVDKDTFVGHIFRQMDKPITRVSLRYGTPLQNSDYKQLQKETKNSIETMLKKIQLEV